jgi:carbamoyl-phosphate synthase small subunit
MEESDKMKAYVMLEDGSVFTGVSFGFEENCIGEIVFNTGMTGYQEVLTDPSYRGQIVTMTYPLIGNYGINEEDGESENPQVKGFIVREYSENPSNFRCQKRIKDYLIENKIVAVEGIDTRALTKTIRDKGTMNGLLCIGEKPEFDLVKDDIHAYEIKDSVEEVTVEEMEIQGEGPYKVALLDTGYKKNIVRSLIKRDVEVHIYPAQTAVEEILQKGYDGIMLSNGPGDPKDCTEIIGNVKKLFDSDVPIFGICLGHQLLALANGFDTAKLKYGHRGCNHPVKDLKHDRTYITSQNHGYAVVGESVDADIATVSHVNINDGTCEGLEYKDKKVFTVQFHPEASPGPSDADYLFDQFMDLVKEGGTNHAS